MKKNIQLILIIICTGLFLIQSCSDKMESTDDNTQKLTSLSGKIYGLTNPPLDTTKCDEVFPSNNSFQKLLFVDDSSFIKIVPATCGDLGVCTRYYSGKYKIDSEALHLTFNPKVVIYHMKSPNLVSPFVELENFDFTEERLIKRHCADKLFFEECDVQGHLMTPKSDILSKEIQYLKENGILDKLF